MFLNSSQRSSFFSKNLYRVKSILALFSTILSLNLYPPIFFADFPPSDHFALNIHSAICSLGCLAKPSFHDPSKDET
jgi:hypothetical protein